MLTSPIKPPLPSPPSPPHLFSLSAPASFSLPACHLNSLCRLRSQPPAFFVVPPAIALRPQHCLLLSQYSSCFSYLCSLSKNSRRPTLRCRLLQTPARTPYVTPLTFHEGGPVSRFFRVHPCWSELSFFLTVHMLNHMWTFSMWNLSQLFSRLICIYRDRVVCVYVCLRHV